MSMDVSFVPILSYYKRVFCFPDSGITLWLCAQVVLLVIIILLKQSASYRPDAFLNSFVDVWITILM